MYNVTPRPPPSRPPPAQPLPPRQPPSVVSLHMGQDSFRTVKMDTAAADTTTWQLHTGTSIFYDQAAEAMGAVSFQFLLSLLTCRWAAQRLVFYNTPP